MKHTSRTPPQGDHEMIPGLDERIHEALAREEERAETFANRVRLLLLIALSLVAGVNTLQVSREANLLNFGALLLGYAYGIMVYLRIRRHGYHPSMKYVTSCLDIVVVFLLLFGYTRIEIPSVALKNYVFLVLFPLIALTAFRYDWILSAVSGGLALGLYLALLVVLVATNEITITHGGYERELFTPDITLIGQGTKVLILTGYILLVSYLAYYSRSLFARLVREELNLQVQKEVTDWELTVASQVQHQFLPASVPSVAGLDHFGAVHQGRFVGGDYYDFIPLADDRLLMVVADVSGKGVPAALIMAEVRASTHLLASMGIPLEDLCRRLNALVHQSTDKKSFVTCFAAEIDPSRGHLTYVNAGHPPPLIWFDGSTRTLARGTLPLGSCASLPNLTPREESFPAGSVLVAFTDGLLEQTNPGGEDFGLERLCDSVLKAAALDARTLGEELLESVRTFGGGGSLSDDVCVAVVRHRESPAD